ncbi:unnamed protein product [Urochloa humidicola]
MVAITGGRTLTVAALLCTMAGMVAAVPWPTSNVKAEYTWYSPMDIGWDLRNVNTYCTRWDADTPLWWRQQFGWAALCEPWDSISGARGYCGSCIKVTNRATGAWIMARIVGKCSGSGLQLDYWSVFTKIDTDGKGFENGYLKVDYKWVPC